MPPTLLTAFPKALYLPCQASRRCCVQVFVEYVTNDGYHHGSVDNSLVRSFERLLRKLLQFRRTPAVVLMEFLATDVRVSKLPFYATGTDGQLVPAEACGRGSLAVLRGSLP